MGLADARLGHRDDLRTVSHFMGILAEDCELRHLSPEGGQHVSFILDVLLPIASGERIYRLRS
jgi:hypothetical protein